MEHVGHDTVYIMVCMVCRYIPYMLHSMEHDYYGVQNMYSIVFIL